ncbi:MAG TPA: methylated-DNA--[protein]-cysteine S-methyltransferase [Noviherbaspirillum sp.]
MTFRPRFPVASGSCTSSIFVAVLKTPFGALGVRTAGEVLRELVYLPPAYEAAAPTEAVAERVARQIECYLRDPDYRFDLPLAPAGTEFQRRVWAAISAIPRGEVLTYGHIAKHLRSAPRAVGQACGANWYPIIIPCHRVTASGGLGGFSNSDDEAGFHLGVKRWLLAHEGVVAYR